MATAASYSNVIGNNNYYSGLTSTSVGYSNNAYTVWSSNDYMAANELYKITISKDLYLLVYRMNNNRIGITDLKTEFHNTDKGTEVRFLPGDIVQFTDLEQAKSFISRIKMQYKKMQMVNRQCNIDTDFV